MHRPPVISQEVFQKAQSFKEAAADAAGDDEKFLIYSVESYRKTFQTMHATSG